MLFDLLHVVAWLVLDKAWVSHAFFLEIFMRSFMPICGTTCIGSRYGCIFNRLILAIWNVHYKVRQPPKSKTCSSLRAITLGRVWLNHNCFTSSYFFWFKNKGFPRLSPLSGSPWTSKYGASKNTPLPEYNKTTDDCLINKKSPIPAEQLKHWC